MEEKITDRDIAMLEILARVMDYFVERDLLVSTSSSYPYTDYGGEGFKGVEIQVHKEQIDIDSCTFVETCNYYDTYIKDGIQYLVNKVGKES